jgi:hypothetical protein
MVSKRITRDLRTSFVGQRISPKLPGIAEYYRRLVDEAILKNNDLLK